MATITLGPRLSLDPIPRDVIVLLPPAELIPALTRQIDMRLEGYRAKRRYLAGKALDDYYRADFRESCARDLRWLRVLHADRRWARRQLADKEAPRG